MSLARELRDKLFGISTKEDMASIRLAGLQGFVRRSRDMLQRGIPVGDKAILLKIIDDRLGEIAKELEKRKW